MRSTALLPALVTGACAAAAAAQPTADWYTVDGGGGMHSAGGQFTLAGTIGQPDASLIPMTGGGFTVIGGFWGFSAGGGCLCEFDTDGAQVDVFDLLAYLDLWFIADAGADLDDAAGVDVFDLLAFLDCWFPASAGAPCA